VLVDEGGDERPVRFGSNGTATERFLHLAARAANAASATIAAHRSAQGTPDPADKTLDLAAETAAASALAPLDVPIYSEESGWIAGRAARNDEHWIALDPIDGTRNCLHGYPPWSTAVGLIDGGRAIAGLVVDLTTGQRWWTHPGAQAYVDDRPLRPQPNGLLILPSTAPDDVPPLQAVAGFSRLRLAGATSIDLCRVADGSAAAFVDIHRAISQPHDIAAAVAVIQAAGAAILDADTGQPPALDPSTPDRAYHLVAAATAHEAESLLTRLLHDGPAR
jgi:3'(2'), 5'-bisphosphate nucleotidase